MDDNASKGGTYLRQADGSLKLVGRTEPTPTVTAEVKAAAPKPASGKKDTPNG